jgi:bifunctional non-homologous end joining protein LigD
MLATPGSLPVGPEWAYEVKWDGVRVLVETGPRGLDIMGRSGSRLGPAFPELASLRDVLPPDTLVDGELVALRDGRPSFHSLLPRLHASPARAAGLAASTPATVMAFDLLRLRGSSTIAEPYKARRELLCDLPAASGFQVPPSFDDGGALFEATAAEGLEGVVAKRRESSYHPGVRHPDWVKTPHRRRRSFVVGGYRPGTSPGPGRIGSLLVGTPVGDGRLSYDGAVGSGLSAAEQRTLRAVLDQTAVDRPPFDDAASLPADGVWCEAIVVVDVDHLGRGGQGLLRQAAVARVRPDRDYTDVLSEQG